MKIVYLLPFALLLFTACEKEVNLDKEPVYPTCGTPNNPACLDVPPTNELCQAYFVRWFYNSQTNECDQIGYSGCEQYGFATQQECEDCAYN